MIVNATITNSETTLLTCSNVAGSAVVAVMLTNTDASARTVTVHARPAGEAAADENAILYQTSIPPGETHTITDKILMANTDVLSAIDSASGSKVTASVIYTNL